MSTHEEALEAMSTDEFYVWCREKCNDPCVFKGQFDASCHCLSVREHRWQYKYGDSLVPGTVSSTLKDQEDRYG